MKRLGCSGHCVLAKPSDFPGLCHLLTCERLCVREGIPALVCPSQLPLRPASK